MMGAKMPQPAPKKPPRNVPPPPPPKEEGPASIKLELPSTPEHCLPVRDRSRPLRVLSLVRASDMIDGGALIGLTAEDDVLLSNMAQHGATTVSELIVCAEAWGYALMIRTDIPRVA